MDPLTRVGTAKFKLQSNKENLNLDASTRMSGKEFNKSLPATRRVSAPAKGGVRLTIASGQKGNSNASDKTKVNQNVRRKALADVSNVQSRYLRDAVNDGSKSAFSMGPGRKNVNPLSRKSSMVKIKNDGSYETTNRRVGLNGTRASSQDQGTNSDNSESKSGARECRRITAYSLIPRRRNSSVVSKSVINKTNTTKGDYDCSEKAQRMSGIPVRANASKKAVQQVSKTAVPQVSTVRSHLSRIGTSNGFRLAAPRDKNNVGASVLSRNSIRPAPISRNALKAQDAKRTSGSIVMSSMHNSVSNATCKGTEETATSNNLESILISSLSEIAKGKTSDDGQKKTTTNESEVVARRRPKRRKSYTALLMERSKLLEQHGEVTAQESLPTIYDECNQLEVAEYVDEIYHYYWVSEAQSPSLANYMSIQTDVSPQMRGILVNWLIEVHFKFELMQETLYLMVTLLDQYLSQVQIKTKDMQLVGLTALLLASKYEDYWHPRIKDLISISAEAYTRDQVLVMESLFLRRLKFRLNMPTPYVFMLRFLRASRSDLKLEHLAFYLIELTLVEYEALKFKPSMLCASAIYVARSTLQQAPAWTPLLAKHTHHGVPEIRECAEMMLRFQKSAPTSHLKVTYEKYLSPDLSSVAAIMPLDKLSFSH